MLSEGRQKNCVKLLKPGKVILSKLRRVRSPWRGDRTEKSALNSALPSTTSRQRSLFRTRLEPSDSKSQFPIGEPLFEFSVACLPAHSSSCTLWCMQMMSDSKALVVLDDNQVPKDEKPNGGQSTADLILYGSKVCTFCPLIRVYWHCRSSRLESIVASVHHLCSGWWWRICLFYTLQIFPR